MGRIAKYAQLFLGKEDIKNDHYKNNQWGKN
jgi:hypothetical protein